MNISTPKYGTVQLGRQGENLATKVVLDASALKIVPGHPVLVHQRSNDSMPYPCEITEVGDTVEWLVTSADTQYAGKGRLELRWYGDNDELIKSAIYNTVTVKALAEPGEPPEPLDGYISQIEKKLADKMSEPENEGTPGQVLATDGNGGRYWATVQGGEGTQGKDGITPHIGENKNWFIGDTDTGIRAEGVDGKDGAPGQQGIQGDTGVSVDSVEIEPSGYDDSDGNGCGCTDGKDGVGITNITITEE